MKWRSGRRSQNVEDRRGQSPGRGGIGLPIWALVPLLRTKRGWVIVLVAVIGIYLWNAAASRNAPVAGTDGAPDEGSEFVRVVLGSTEDVWSQLFAADGGQYQAPRLVLFDDVVRSACGMTSAATGPFYCPADRQVYLDLGFFRDLERLGGVGDFAGAYVIGHEVGHHVQNLVGTSDQVRQAQLRANQAQANALSVRLELQADCFAGLWAYHANRSGGLLLEAGDVEEGMAAARAIGDDRQLRRSGRAVSPDAFTHGTSEQRAYWLAEGLRTGSLASCDTFAQ